MGCFSLCLVILSIVKYHTFSDVYPAFTKGFSAHIPQKRSSSGSVNPKVRPPPTDSLARSLHCGKAEAVFVPALGKIEDVVPRSWICCFLVLWPSYFFAGRTNTFLVCTSTPVQQEIKETFFLGA